MTNYAGVVVPATPPLPPPLTLINSSIRPGDESDPAGPIFQVDGKQLAALPSDLAKELRAQQGATWTRGLSYAPENHYAAVARDPCDFTTVDEPALAAPTGLALQASTAAGTLPAGTYNYQVTAVDSNGETTALASTQIITGSTGEVILTWNKGVATSPPSDPVTYKVYGRVGGSIGLLATVGPFAHNQAATYTDASATAVGAAPPSTNTTGGPGSYGNLPIVNYQPFLVVVEDSCSTWGFEERDFKGRALRLLENATPKALEAEFWSGTLATAKSYPNNFLTNSSAPNFVDLTPGSVPSIARGQQILQDYLASTGFGGQGMIHCQPQTAPSLLNARRVGNLLLDVFDNIIVPGVGYPGTTTTIGTPSNTTAVMFATSMVSTRVEAEGTVFPDTFAEALDWGQSGQPNTIRFRAMKNVAAYWDGDIQAGVRVNLAT